MPKLNNEDADLLAQMLAADEEDDPFDAGEKQEEQKRPEWMPLLNPVQRQHWDDPADTVGLVGPKFSGKTAGCLHSIVRHCYLEWDALYWILGNNAAALSEGVCSDLTKFILPTWKDGNVESPYIRKKGVLVPNPNAGRHIDQGIGLEYQGWKYDAQTKHPIMRIRNRYLGWSRIRVISIPHPDLIDDRVRGPAPSGIYLEEATKCKGSAYFTFPSLQLNRRRDIVGPQQFQFSCNPEDPGNWVYEWMYNEVVVPADQPGRDWPDDPEKPGIRREKGVSFRFVPYEDNAHNVSQKNREMLASRLRADPILRKRLYEGRWMAYPSGEAIFKDEFSEAKHMRGDLEKHQGLLPVRGFPILLGYDLGFRSVGISFQQIIETPEGPFLMFFDELCYHKEMVKSRRLAHAVVEKLRFWNEWLRREDGDPTARWSVWHIAGDDATTVYRPGQDSVDAKDIQDHSRAIIEGEPERYRGIDPIFIRGCPRPPGSREKRVDLIAEALMDERLLCSQLCPWHKGMFFHLEGDDDAPSTPKKSKWLETFDGCTYPSMYRHLKLPAGFPNLEDAGFVQVMV